MKEIPIKSTPFTNCVNIFGWCLIVTFPLVSSNQVVYQKFWHKNIIYYRNKLPLIFILCLFKCNANYYTMRTFLVDGRYFSAINLSKHTLLSLKHKLTDRFNMRWCLSWHSLLNATPPEIEKRQEERYRFSSNWTKSYFRCWDPVHFILLKQHQTF